MKRVISVRLTSEYFGLALLLPLHPRRLIYTLRCGGILMVAVIGPVEIKLKTPF